MSSSLKRWMGRVAMVTGVHNSTGREIAETLAREGLNVVGVDNQDDTEQLDALAASLKAEGFMFTVFQCDITSQENVKRMFTSIKSDPDLEGVDICIHCDVVALGESILEGNPANWREMLETNVWAAAYITQEVVKSMKERSVDDGHIIFMNGMCSHRLIAGNKSLHFYTATKFACRALLEGLRFELRNNNSQIRVSAISAGVIDTDFLAKLFEGDEGHAKSFLGERKYLDVSDIATAVIYILEQPPHVQIHDILMRSTDQIP